MPPPPPRNCSRDECPPKNMSLDLTWYCHYCKNLIQLLCYEIVKVPGEIFVCDNIVMMCDECLSNAKENLSPKRKQPNQQANLVQRTIDTQGPIMQLSKPANIVTTPLKNVTVKQSQTTNAIIETLVQKVETQTATIAELKSSVESMNRTVSQQKTVMEKSIYMNTENMSSIKQTQARYYWKVGEIDRKTFVAQR